MFIDLGLGVQLSDEEFIEAMAERREKLQVGPNDHVIGCPLCAFDDLDLPDEYGQRPQATEADSEDDADEDDDADGDTPSEDADGATAAPPANR